MTSATLVAGETPAAGGRFRVLYAEPVVISGLAVHHGSGPTRPVPPHASFEAYGRHFDLDLASNGRLVAGLDEAVRSATADVQLLRGSLRGVPDSWVRLTVDGDRQSGMVWDTQDLYVIEPAEDVAPRAVGPLAASGRTPVVYRLSDTQPDPGFGACVAAIPEDPHEKPSGLDDYKALVGELRQAAKAASLTGRLRVSTLADHEYFQYASSVRSAQNRILAIFNDVDGIFSAQVGVQIELAGEVTVFQDPADPFTKSDAGKLLTELANYRNSRSTLRNTGLTHLVTGRDLDGSTAGIGYIGVLCQPRFGSSLSQGTSGLASLVVAHEIGHNFGAPHDGEAAAPGQPTGSCESTPGFFLMAPQINGNDQFSQCSLSQMQRQIEAAGCMLPAATGVDVRLATSTASVTVTAGQLFALDASVASNGPADAQAVQLVFTLPNGLAAIDGAATSDGSCATQAGGIACSWSTLGAGVTAAVSINMRAETAGSYVVPAALAAAMDTSSGNDALTFQVTATAPSPPPAPASSAQPPSAPRSSGSGGGGGSPDSFGLLALLALGASRRTAARFPRRATGCARRS